VKDFLADDHPRAARRLIVDTSNWWAGTNVWAAPGWITEVDLGRSAGKRGIMRGFVQDIEGLAVKNVEFRQVLYTAKHCQLVVMALKPKEEIGAEVHTLDQFFRVEEGAGEAVLDGVRTAIRAGFAVVVPAGTNHNIINTGSVPLKLYTLYAPPNHRDGVVHQTRADAEADTEHFDGKTTE
jgi:mannose-6-phosphate isomerase-like protein (cupin superfamily)